MSMKFTELPRDVQTKLLEDQKKLANKLIANDGYEINVYNKFGSRHFRAKRVQHSWQDDKGNSMSFGGGSHWEIHFCFVSFHKTKNPFGQTEYELCDGNRIERLKCDDGKIIEIPFLMNSKNEVLDLIKQIGGSIAETIK